MLKKRIKPEQINCDGCLSSGRLFFYSHTCDIRKCCLERGLKNCAYCGDYPCEKLVKFFKSAPYAKTALDEMRMRIKK